MNISISFHKISINSQLAALFLLLLLLSLGECFGVVEKFDKFNFEMQTIKRFKEAAVAADEL